MYLLFELFEENKKRGKTILNDVHARSMKEQKTILLNDKNQLCGPDDKTVAEFSSFLGTLARTTDLAPLVYVSWPAVPNKQLLWDYVRVRAILKFFYDKNRTIVLLSVDLTLLVLS